MQYRNLKRHVLASKSLQKYNKKSSVQVSKKELVYLTLLLLMEQAGIKRSTNKFRDVLLRCGYNTNWLHVIGLMQDLIDNGYLEKPGITYNITPSGYLVLDRIESLLTDERIDK